MDLKKRLPLITGIFAVFIIAVPVYVYMFMGKPNNAMIVKADPQWIDRITFGSAAGEYSLMRAEGGNWYIDGAAADSAITNSYIQTLVSAECSEVSDKSVENRKPFAGITVSTPRGNHFVKVYTSTKGEILLTSSDCEGTVFRTDSAGVFGQLFRPEAYFAATASK